MTISRLWVQLLPGSNDSLRFCVPGPFEPLLQSQGDHSNKQPPPKCQQNRKFIRPYNDALCNPLFQTVDLKFRPDYRICRVLDSSCTKNIFKMEIISYCWGNFSGVQVSNSFQNPNTYHYANILEVYIRFYLNIHKIFVIENIKYW